MGDCRPDTLCRPADAGGRAGRSFGRRGAGLHLFEKLVDAGSVVFGVVQREVEFRYPAKLEALEDLVTDEADSVFEGLDGAFLFFFGAARADEDAGIAAVRREADFIDHDRDFQARILEFAGQHGVDFMGDFFADAFVTMVGCGHGSAVVFLQHRGKKHKPPPGKQYQVQRKPQARTTRFA